MTNERLRLGWARSDKMLRRVYAELGPKHVERGKFRVYSSRKFAALTLEQARERWDFDNIELMHKVARVIEKE